MNEFNVETGETHLSALEILQRRIPAAPKAYLRQLFKKGKISGRNGTVSEQDRLHPGDTLRLPTSDRLRELLTAPIPPSREITILYESREFLIVEKPAGLAIHSSIGHEADNLAARVTALLKQRGEKFKIAPIHRLDLETSGPVLFGKGKQACGMLGKMFMQHGVDKHYLALASGTTAGGGRLHSLVPSKGKQKEALTTYCALARSDSASLLELALHSGRQHQIRRQLAESGHPLFGDRRYGGPCPADLPRLFLHCRRLAFIDPFSGARLEIESALPKELADFLPGHGIAPSAAE